MSVSPRLFYQKDFTSLKTIFIRKSSLNNYVNTVPGRQPRFNSFLSSALFRSNITLSHTFDFGDYADGAREAGGKITYHKYGLGMDQTDGNGNILKSLSTVIEELGHQNRVIDIFKIDCEGCEWATSVNWFEAAAKHNVTIRQIQVELHGPPQRLGAPPQEIHNYFDLMYKHGYVIFHKEMNMLAKEQGGNCIEYAFLKLDPEFVNAEQRIKAAEAMETKAAFE